MNFRELTNSAEDFLILRKFYELLYVAEFPDPDERESLENMQRYLQLKSEGWYGENNYHIMIILEDEIPVGGSISDYLAEPNAGVIEFLVISPQMRTRGLGAKLLEFTENLFVLDAQNSLGRPLDCIVAEMNDPFTPAETEDNLDPFLRVEIWDKWGYRLLDFPYIQPALSEDQSAVRHLLLMCKPYSPGYYTSLPGDIVKKIVHQYIYWAMRIEQPQLCVEYREMGDYLDLQEAIPLVSLGNYIGRDAKKHLYVRGIAAEDETGLEAAIELYRRVFTDQQTAVQPETFRERINEVARERGNYAYHFWSLSAKPRGKVEGIGSFFTFPPAGFGGYVALEGSLKGTGRLRLLLARMEEQMLRDNLGADGWFIECELDVPEVDMFHHLGFRAVSADYRQPPLHTNESLEPENSPRLLLMYKNFGRVYQNPVLRKQKFLEALEWIFRVVYRIHNPRRSSYFKWIFQQIKLNESILFE